MLTYMHAWYTYYGVHVHQFRHNKLGLHMWRQLMLSLLAHGLWHGGGAGSDLRKLKVYLGLRIRCNGLVQHIACCRPALRGCAMVHLQCFWLHTHEFCSVV